MSLFMYFPFRYAVLDGNACLCTNTITEPAIHLTECDRPCAENHKEFCGGGYAQSYYDTNMKGVGPPRNVQIVDKTDTSMFIEWFAPEQLNSLTRYNIRANILKKFGSNDVSALPQWTVENTNSKIEYELSDLNPGNYIRRTLKLLKIHCIL